MDRKKVMDAILEYYRTFGSSDQVIVVKDALKMMPDMDLLILAKNVGIDTGALLAVRS